MSPSFYRSSNCIILVFDVTSAKTFQSLDRWRTEALDSLGADASTFPIVVVGNKTDLSDTREVTEQQAREWCAAHGNCPYFETVAVSKQGIEPLFAKVVNVSKPKDTEMTMLPTSLAGAGGAMQLSAEDDIRRSVLVQERQKSKDKCC